SRSAPAASTTRRCDRGRTPSEWAVRPARRSDPPARWPLYWHDYPLYRHWAAWLYPPDDPLAPGVDQSQRQRQDEYDDLDEAEPAELLEDDRPREDEDDIHVEGHEEQREDVERQRELHPGRADGRLA